MRRLTPCVVLAVVLVAGACGDDEGDGGRSEQGAGCAPVQREALDPASASGHVLPGAPEPRYLTDPPTSGPHGSAAPKRGVLTEPLTKPEQVSLLEGGDVLLQHRDLSADDRASLEGLAAEDVTVAPNPNLPATVVATAWTVKQTCERVDVASLREFIRDHRGKGAPH